MIFIDHNSIQLLMNELKLQALVVIPPPNAKADEVVGHCKLLHREF